MDDALYGVGIYRLELLVVVVVVVVVLPSSS
jgi:hypothetical protein